MYHQFTSRSILILVLLGLYCYASPISSVDQNQASSSSSSATIDEPPMKSDFLEIDRELFNPSLQPRFSSQELNGLRILCAFYIDCSNLDRSVPIEDKIKYKRLSSSLFHGIPKFGKRAFSSAFSGIPKFG